MNQQKNRKSFIQDFINNRNYNERVRRLVRKRMLAEEKAITLTELILLYVSFLASTEEEHRVVY